MKILNKYYIRFVFYRVMALLHSAHREFEERKKMCVIWLKVHTKTLHSMNRWLFQRNARIQNLFNFDNSFDPSETNNEISNEQWAERNERRLLNEMKKEDERKKTGERLCYRLTVWLVLNKTWPKKNGEVNDVRDRHKADVYLKRLVFSNLLVYCGVFHQNIPRKK